MKLAAILLILAAPALAAEPVVLLDFETGEPADGWTMRGLGLAEVTLPEGATPSGGRALALIGEDRGGRASGYVHRPIGVNDWRRFRALSLFAKVEAEGPIRMRIIARDGRGPRGVLRRFVLEPGDWREVVLPLADWREDFHDQVGDFRRVERILFRWDGGKGRVTIDDVRLLPGERGDESCRPSAEAHLAVAFGDERSFAREGDGFLLLTDVRKLRGRTGRKLLARLSEARALLADRYGVPGELDHPVPFFVFSRAEDFRSFYPRLGEHLGAGVPEPTGDGFTAFGTAGSWWDPAQGEERPVYASQAAKCVVRRLLGIATNGNWVQRGLAGAVQVRLRPESAADVDFRRNFRKLAAGAGGPFLPWTELFAARAPGSRATPQLLTIVEHLADEHRERLGAVWTAVAGLSEPLHESAPAAIAEVLGLTLEEWEEAWLAWGLSTY